MEKKLNLRRTTFDMFSNHIALNRREKQIFRILMQQRNSTNFRDTNQQTDGPC